MTPRQVSEVSEASPGLSCDFKDGSICQRPGTTYIEWDTDGIRDRGVYCDEHASLELEEYAEPSLEEQLRADHEALTDPFDEAVLLSQAAEGQPVEHLWSERAVELAELHGIRHEGGATSQSGGADQTVLAAARSALERRAAGLRATVAALPSDVTLDYAGRADEADAHAETLRTLDPAERLDQRRIDALHAGRQALRTEVDGWRNLAEVATTADRRGELDARAAEAERLWTRATTLQQRLEERDRDAEQECER
jgi:hypothetical protein